MPGATNGTGTHQTPIPVPVPSVFQAQNLTQQANNAPLSSTTAGGLTGAATPSALATSKAPVASVVPPSSTAQTASTPLQAHAQPTPRPAAMPVAQTPVPAPIPPMILSSAAGPPVAAPAPAALPAVPSPAPVGVVTPAPLAAATGPKATTAKTTAPPRKTSPERPKVEPLTPPLGPVQFPPPRQSHAYSGHPEQQTAIAPPAPEPIEFGSNPDVLALQSAISILQLQSAKAKRDMIALQKAKEAALADPEAFIEDLEAGKVHMGGTGLTASLENDDSDDDSSDSDAENGAGGIKNEPGAMAVDPKSKSKREKPSTKPWSQLPNKQNVVRMPPINWSQYAVVGESLDRLHKEQVSHPSQGTPATIGADGTFIFQGTGRQEENRGIAAPYDPLKDKLPVKKPRSKTPSRQQG